MPDIKSNWIAGSVRTHSPWWNLHQGLQIHGDQANLQQPLQLTKGLRAMPTFVRGEEG